MTRRRAFVLAGLFALAAVFVGLVALTLARVAGPVSPEAESGTAPAGTGSSGAPSTAGGTKGTGQGGVALLSKSDLAEFRRTFGSGSAIAVQDLTGAAAVWTGDEHSPYAWSTIKVVIVARTVYDSGGPSGLSSAQRGLVARALGQSDNAAAASLYEDLMARHGGMDGAAESMDALLRRAGDTDTRVSTVGRDGFSAYGQTLWTPRAQAQFLSMFARGCVLDAASTGFVLEQMGHVASEHRWGLADVGSRAFKGGWGPDPGGAYLVRQFGLVTAPDGRPYAVAIMSRPADGTFESGRALNTATAEWVAARVATAPEPAPCA